MLIFSQFTRMLDILEDYLTLAQYPTERIDGSVGLRERQAAIDRYSKGALRSSKGACPAGIASLLGSWSYGPAGTFDSALSRPSNQGRDHGKATCLLRRTGCCTAISTLTCSLVSDPESSARAPRRRLRRLCVPAVHARRRAGHHADRRGHRRHL